MEVGPCFGLVECDPKALLFNKFPNIRFRFLAGPGSYESMEKHTHTWVTRKPTLAVLLKSLYRKALRCSVFLLFI